MKRRIPLGYWNSNGIATAIVAVATYFNDSLFDWAAYIGGTTKTWHEEDAYVDVAEYGCKLPVRIAVHLAMRQGYGSELTADLYRP